MSTLNTPISQNMYNYAPINSPRHTYREITRPGKRFLPEIEQSNRNIFAIFNLKAFIVFCRTFPWKPTDPTTRMATTCRDNMQLCYAIGKSARDCAIYMFSS